MVQMSSQETVIRAGHYAPIVNYNQPAKAPMPEQREPDVDTKSDWGGAIASAITNLGNAYVKTVEKQEKNKTAQRDNSFALQYQQVVDAQRAGEISPYEANVRMSNITTAFLQTGADPKDVSKIRNDFSGGIPKLEEETQKYYNQEMLKHSSNVLQEMGKDNPGFAQLNPIVQRDVYNKLQAISDDCVNIQAQLAAYEPGSDEYKSLEAQLMSKYKNKTGIQACLKLTKMFAEEKDINDLSLAEMKNNFAQYAASEYGMSVNESGPLFDIVSRDLGLQQIAFGSEKERELSSKDLEETNKMILANYDNYVYTNMTGLTLGRRAGLGDAINQGVLTMGEFYPVKKIAATEAVNAMEKMRVGDYEGAANALSESAVPDVARGVNDTLSSPVASPKTKSAVTNMGFRLFNKYSLPNVEMENDQLNILASNHQGITKTISVPLAQQEVKKGLESNNASVVKDSQETQTEINKCNSAGCFFNFYNRPEYNNVAGMFKNKDILKQLRYSPEDGHLFYTDSLDREQSWFTAAFGVPAEAVQDRILRTLLLEDGTMSNKIATMNKVANNLKTTDEKIEFFKMFNVKEAQPGEEDIDRPGNSVRSNIFKHFIKGSKDILNSINIIGEANAAEYSSDGKPLSAIEMQQMDQQYNQQVADELLRKADNLEKSTANLDSAAAKEYGAGNKKIIEAARAKAKELTASASMSSSETLANADLTYTGSEHNLKDVVDREAEDKTLNEQIKAVKAAIESTADINQKEHLKDTLEWLINRLHDVEGKQRPDTGD